MKITLENIISSLLCINFDRIDNLLCTLTIGYIILHQNEDSRYHFEIINQPFSETFQSYIEYDGYGFKLKDNYNLLSKVGIHPYYRTLKTRLQAGNDKLIEYLRTIDYKEIIKRKLNMLGPYAMNEYAFLFSEQEKCIIKLNGIEQSNAEELKMNNPQHLKVYRK